MKRLVAVDWGTTSLRGALLDEAGLVLEERAFARGILNVAAHEFAGVFLASFAAWMDESDTLCLVSGMAGSKLGWIEAPYCACPAGFADIARQLTWVQPGRIAIVPGLRCETNGIAGAAGLERLPDVMRGEETQVFGALKLTGLADGLFVLPGTHSKWVQVESGVIVRFTTYMTGEIYALLSQQSILARSLPRDEAAFDGPAFDQGVAMALSHASLLQTAFSVRTLGLFERMPQSSLGSYLSGLLIGEELRAQAPDPADNVVLIGSDHLTGHYARALRHCEVNAQRVGTQACWRGLWAIARALEAPADDPLDTIP